MNIEEFKKSIDSNKPPENYSEPLKALWYDGKGDWKMAHQYAQKDEGNLIYDRIHAYLHRKEGDIFNAKWWYNRIKVPFPSIGLRDEWEILVSQYLE
jgi:hypothetical protein